MVDRDNSISSLRPVSSLPEIHPDKVLGDDNDVIPGVESLCGDVKTRRLSGDNNHLTGVPALDNRESSS